MYSLVGRDMCEKYVHLNCKFVKYWNELSQFRICLIGILLKNKMNYTLFCKMSVDVYKMLKV